MKYLLDTNIISEMQKPQCNPKVKEFIESIPTQDMYICSVTIGEVCYGAEKLPAGKKKHDLSIWLYTQLPQWFDGRVISLDTDAMEEWGHIRSYAKRTMPVMDTLIAAAAISRHLTLVTRNTGDFKDVEGIMLMNPWE